MLALCLFLGSLRGRKDLPNNSTNSHEDTQSAFICDTSSTDSPSNADNGDGLQMAYYRACHGTRATNDEKLRDIDQRRKATTHQNHQPAIDGYIAKNGDVIHNGDCKQEHDTSNGSLVEEQLRRRHLEFLVVGSDEDSVGG